MYPSKPLRYFLLQAGHLRTEQGEYWIEPSNQIPTDSSKGRPHIIFKRSAVDKVESFYRKKRDAGRPSYTNNNSNVRRFENPKRSHKEAKDARRRAYLEERRRKLEALREDPVAYRRQQTRRAEQRRLQSISKSVSTENSMSREQISRHKTAGKYRIEKTPQRIRTRRRRRRSKNCATKQPRYQWENKNLHGGKHEGYRNTRYSKVIMLFFN